MMLNIFFIVFLKTPFVFEEIHDASVTLFFSLSSILRLGLQGVEVTSHVASTSSSFSVIPRYSSLTFQRNLLFSVRDLQCTVLCTGICTILSTVDNNAVMSTSSFHIRECWPDI